MMVQGWSIPPLSEYQSEYGITFEQISNKIWPFLKYLCGNMLILDHNAPKRVSSKKNM